MRIKKFTAATVREAMAQMKMELGEDAIILKSNKVQKDGLMDFMGKDMFEILAAVDKDAVPVERNNEVSSNIAQIVQAAKNSQAAKPVSNAMYSSPSVKTAVLERPRSSSNGGEFNSMQFGVIKTEIAELKDSLSQVGSFLKYQSVPSLPKNLQLVMKQLLDNGVEEHLARDLVEDIQQELKGRDYNDLKLIVSLLLTRIAGRLRTAESTPAKKSGPKVITLIGPTGVGKTTTIAKLATNQKLLSNKKVALISADTFRIGAVDQLKTFANIADIPFAVAYTTHDMQAALKKFRDMDIVYIDTTGRSQKDTERLKDLKKFIDASNSDEIHLCMSVNTLLRSQIDVAERFSIMKYNRVVLTKVDETTCLGGILNLTEHIKQPVSYLTMGQNVPEDVQKASVEKMAKMVVRRKSN